MEINEFIMPAVVLAAYCTCYVFTGMYPEQKRFTPLVAAFTGVIAALAVTVPTGVSSVANTIVAGLVSGLASTGVWEGYKNIIKDGD